MTSDSVGHASAITGGTPGCSAAGKGLQGAWEELAVKEVVVLGKFAKNICFGTLLPPLWGFYGRGKRRKKINKLEVFQLL